MLETRCISNFIALILCEFSVLSVFLLPLNEACSSTVRISTARHGAISTIKSYSFTRPDEDNCWLVDAPTAIEFKLLHFDFANNTNCESAWLTIYDGPTIFDRLVTVICKNGGPGRESFFTGPYGLVRYQTGPEFNGGEFALRYSQASSIYNSKQRLFSSQKSFSYRRPSKTIGAILISQLLIAFFLQQ